MKVEPVVINIAMDQKNNIEYIDSFPIVNAICFKFGILLHTYGHPYAKWDNGKRYNTQILLTDNFT